jgi:hypothetical protein
MSDESENGRTIRILLLSTTIVMLGLFLLLFKSGWCQTKPEEAPQCKEQFIEMTRSGYAMNVECSPGATVEMVSSPPAPKAGVFCRCSNKPLPPIAAPSAQ